jgi:phosphoglycolate phosphatase
MLILFDIDGTILLTEGAGVHAMGDAGRELFGDQFTIEGIEFSGRLDSLIWKDLVRLNQVEDTDVNHDRFRAGYGRHLHRRLHERPTARLLPGVKEMVHRLAVEREITIGLLTGNYPETGRLKIERAGLDPDMFTVAAWGIDGRTRRDLPSVAIRRHRQQSGVEIEPEHVVIIGDTPHDIDCARHNGCRSIGVATGQFDVRELQASGADLAIADLADTAAILGWILKQTVTVAE